MTEKANFRGKPKADAVDLVPSVSLFPKVKTASNLVIGIVGLPYFACRCGYCWAVSFPTLGFEKLTCISMIFPFVFFLKPTI